MNFIQEPCAEASMRAGRAAAPCSRAARPWLLAATILGSSLAFIDGSVVNLALPALQAQFAASIADLQWVIEAYALFLAALLLVGGALGDRYGRKRIYASGVALFALASLGCGAASGMPMLIVARCVQGVGAALLVPGSLAIISASFEPDERGRAIASWSGFSAITAALGPVLGGLLIETLSWRAIFFINLPLALVVLVLVRRYVPESREARSRGGLDWRGAILATLGLGAIVYALIESGSRGPTQPALAAALAGGIVLLLLFYRVERSSPNPMLPLGLFKTRNFSGANMLTLFLYAALGGALFFLPLNLIQLQGYSASAAGAAMLPFVLILFLLSRWSGGLIARFGPRLPLAGGSLIAAAGYALFMVPGVGGSYWATYFPALLVLGVGMAVCIAPLTTTVMNAVAADHAGAASGINNAVARTAGLLAIALFGLVMSQVFNTAFERHLSIIPLTAETHRAIDVQRVKLAGITLPANLDTATNTMLQKAVQDSFVTAFRRLMLVSSVLALFSALSAWLWIGRRS